MWRLFVFFIFGVMLCLVAGSLPQNVSAVSNLGWVTDSIVRMGEVASESLSSDSKMCSGKPDIISVVGESSYIDACTFGASAGTRLARYRGAGNEFAYAIAFPSDSSFFQIRGVCAGMTRCVYGQAGDTLLVQMVKGEGTYTYASIKDFTKSLRRISSYYQFEHQGPYHYLRVGSTDVSTGAVGVSSNGRWALIELPEYGLIRYDLQSLKYKRVATYNSLPRYNNLQLELTITDDGKWIAVAGYDGGVPIYEISDSCGDELTESSNEYFPEEAQPCRPALVRTSSLIAGFKSSHVPRFSHDSERLLLNIETHTKSVTATFAQQLTGSGNPLYLAFGDSFSSGEGELSDSFYINSTNTATNRCHVSSRSYPYLLGNYWDIATLNLACSGSRIAGVQEANRWFISGDTSTRPSLASLGIGGNDVDFMGKLKSCIGLGTCEWAKEENRKSTAQEIKDLFPKMVDIITELKTNLSPAQLFVVGYPSVINDAAEAQCSMVVGTLLNADERKYMSEAIKYLNTILKAAASYTKVLFVDIETSYFGERLCDRAESAMNGVRYGDDIAPIPMAGNLKLIGAESFHPTPRGHELATQTMQAQLASLWTSPACTNCHFDDSQIDMPEFWLEKAQAHESLVRQLSNIFLNSETLINISNVAVNFIPNMFAPFSLVKFELHSDIQQLGTLTAGSDGSLQGSVAVPGNVEGYHTIHAYGESRSGEKLDVYQTVYIDTKEVSGSEITKQTVDALAHEVFKSSSNDSQGSATVEVATSSAGAMDILGQGTTFAPGQTSKTIQTSQRRSASDNSILWWYIVCLLGAGLLLLGVLRLLAKRNNKTLPGHKDR